ncbi:MAG TPA: sigma-70 family RNA polymerase sigma factor [Planctomycetota bacterium]|nr:sigma-70 family RNA polymerase sigma factor [Planctomycetota bacterium]
MRALAQRLVRDPDVADDVLQRACLLALQQSPDHVRTGERLRAWLAGVTRRTVGHAWRGERRRLRREQLAARPEALPSTVDLAARRELLRRLVEAVTALDEPYFSTLVRRYYEGLTPTEIAAQDGIAPEAVRQRLARARQELRGRLEKTMHAGWLTLPSPAQPTWHHFVRGLLMVEKSSRPFVLKSVAAIILAMLGVAVWLTVRTGSGAHENDHVVATSPASRTDVRSPTAGASLPQVAQAPAVPVHPDAPAASAAPAATPEATASGAPSAGSSSTWDQLWKAADATVRGDVGVADVVSTSQTLLALLEAQGVDPVSLLGSARHGASQTVPLMDMPGVGKASVTVSSGKDDHQKPVTAFAFDVELVTRSGYYTGVQQGQDESTKLSISYSFDEQGAPRSCNTLVQNIPGGRDLHARLHGLAPANVGGVLSLSGESGYWMPITLQAIQKGEENPAGGGPAGADGLLSRMGDRVARNDSLADPRMSAFTGRLSGR